MLVTARHMGEPLEGYEEIDHPVQQRILRLLAVLGGASPEDIAVASDGCGVPTFGMTLGQMALSFARLVDPSGLDDRTVSDGLAKATPGSLGSDDPTDTESSKQRRGVLQYAPTPQPSSWRTPRRRWHAP